MNDFLSSDEHKRKHFNNALFSVFHAITINRDFKHHKISAVNCGLKPYDLHEDRLTLIELKRVATIKSYKFNMRVSK